MVGLAVDAAVTHDDVAGAGGGGGGGGREGEERGAERAEVWAAM